jgi:hypothetical protein
MPLANSQHFISASDLGLSAVALNATKTSTWINTLGYTDVTIMYEYTYDAATELQFEIDTSHNKDAATPTAYEVLGGAIAQSGGETVETLEPYVAKRAVSASEKKRFTFRLNDQSFRLRISSTGGSVNDLITVRLLLGAMSA